MSRFSRVLAEQKRKRKRIHRGHEALCQQQERFRRKSDADRKHSKRLDLLLEVDTLMHKSVGLRIGRGFGILNGGSV
ncbi:hypothetical protein LCGC14_1993580 [marine sediment metagenome]|uniref:Uncharacterized protein n=1 Tax=marine sediment metagenome TaxID=412755 RepID=A0A0F9I2I4_9ZZZZ